MPDGLDALGESAADLRSAFGVSAVHTAAATEADTTITMRCSRGDAVLVASATGRLDVRRLVGHIAQAALAAPVDGDRYVIATGPWAGTWFQDGPPQATAAGEWVLDLVNEQPGHTIDPDAGYPDTPL